MVIPRDLSRHYNFGDYVPLTQTVSWGNITFALDTRFAKSGVHSGRRGFHPPKVAIELRRGSNFRGMKPPPTLPNPLSQFTAFAGRVGITRPVSRRPAAILKKVQSSRVFRNPNRGLGGST